VTPVPAAGFESAKIGDDYRATTRGHMVKRTVIGDSAHQVRVVRNRLFLVDRSSSISMEGIPLLRCGILKMQKSAMFVPAAVIGFQNGWHEEIQRIE